MTLSERRENIGPVHGSSRIPARVKKMEEHRYHLGSGRAVRLVRLHVDCTYAGLLEGTPAAATPHLLARAHDDVVRTLPPGRPLLVVHDGTAELPAYRLIAEFESRRGVETNDPDWASRLFVCWFVDDVGTGTVDHFVRSVLRSVDWARHAHDFDSTLF